MAASKPLLLQVDLGAELECPVCLDVILEPPVHVCQNGHMLCITCHERLKANQKECPVCRGSLDGHRNLFAEQLLAKLPQKKCKNKGCNFQTASEDKVKDHEATCEHREVECFVCSKPATLSGMANHLSTIHDDEGFEEEFDKHKIYGLDLKEFKGKGLMGLTTKIKDGSKTLNFFLVQTEHEDRILLWVYHNQPSNAQKYEYTISILSGNAFDKVQKVRIVKHSAYCLPLDVKVDAMKKSMFCLAIPLESANEVRNSDGKLCFELHICKAAAKYNMRN